MIDFCELIDIYTKKRRMSQQKDAMICPDMKHATNDISNSANGSLHEEDRILMSDVDDSDDDGGNDDEVNLTREEGLNTSRKKQMSVEYLEDEVDVFQSVDDWDGTILSSML